MKHTFILIAMISALLSGCKKTDPSTVPSLSTAAVSVITFNTATGGGDVTADGKEVVTARGVCWSTSTNPTISNSKTSDGAGTGVFVSSLTGLSAGTTYYIRSYATNSIGTAYGNEISFATNALKTAALTTTLVTGIATTTAVSGGNISGGNGSPVTDRGVCWNIATNPTITGSHTSDGNGTGSFTSSLTGLSPGTTYYVRAFATNGIGTSYGNEITFVTSPIQSPTLTTDAVTLITFSTATSGGNVTSDNGSPVTARGVCWSISPGATIAGTHTSDGSGTGVFVSNLTGLIDGTLYYVRSYATNGIGTAYGNENSFTTVLNPALYEVIIQSMAFIPQTITVPLNATVRWRNKDNVAHTVTSDNASWDSGNIPVGNGKSSTFSFPFTAVGTYHYHCALHPMMTGTVIVQ